MEIFDVVTDFIFGISLILPNQEGNFLFLLGWTSMIFTVFGVIGAFCKYMAYRKLIAYQVEMLKEQRNNTSAEEIRVRIMDIDVLSLMICCVEDVPQTAIVLIATSGNTWTAASILTIILSIFSFLLKMAQIIAAKAGCKDNHNDNWQAVPVSTERTEMIGNLEANGVELGVFDGAEEGLEDGAEDGGDDGENVGLNVGSMVG